MYSMQQHQPPEAFASGSRKRARDGDDEDMAQGSMGFSEHRNVW
jgi:hypothetical protein